MSKLLDSILNKNLVEANENFLERMEYIKEQKLHEAKRMLQAESSKEDWAAYRKAHPSLGAFEVPSKNGKTTKVKKPVDKVAAKRKAGYKKAADVLGDPAEKRKQKFHRPEPKPEPAPEPEKTPEAPKVDEPSKKYARLKKTADIVNDMIKATRG